MTESEKDLTAQDYIERGEPYGWFDKLYERAGGNSDGVPWAAMQPRPAFAEWLKRQPHGAGKSALVIACGLGDDAEALAAHGYDVTAFDISPRAIAWCKERFPNSSVDYCVADMFHPPEEWVRGFDLVLEVFVVQALPIDMRKESITAVTQFVAPGGTLLNVSIGVPEDAERGGPPWPFKREEIAWYTQDGLVEVRFEEMEPSNGSARWRIEHRRPK